jgi:acetamidase/formamidase
MDASSSTGFDVLPELRNIHQQVKRGSGNHIFTGPIFVRGAAVGDVLEVRICDIELRQNWGYNLFAPMAERCPRSFHTIVSSISSLTASAM